METTMNIEAKVEAPKNIGAYWKATVEPTFKKIASDKKDAKAKMQATIKAAMDEYRQFVKAQAALRKETLAKFTNFQKEFNEAAKAKKLEKANAKKALKLAKEAKAKTTKASKVAKPAKQVVEEK